ncbi:MAG: VWA domain-containing protein [Gemmatimonadales bacterium]
MLLRCAPGSSAACLAASATLSPDQIRQAGTAGVRGLDWRGRFLGDTGLIGKGRRSRSVDPDRSSRVLILVDVSGSMRSSRFATTRWVVRDFLATLDSLPRGSVRVAVAAFGSVGVAAGIRNAAFTTPDSAVFQVEALRNPDRENTGLFSAIETGTTRLVGELRAAEAGGLGALVVITDGDNDVRPGDDPDLLTGAEGLAQAARTVDQSPVVVSIIGIGNLNQTALTALAGRRGRKTVVDEDQYEMSKALGEIRGLLWSGWEVVVPIGAAREEIGRGLASLGLTALVGRGAFDAPPAVWAPPVMALPAFGGVASADLAPAGADLRSVFDGRLLLALMMLVLLVMLWVVVPRLLWPALPAEVPPGGAAPALPATKRRRRRHPAACAWMSARHRRAVCPKSPRPGRGRPRAAQ